MEDKPKRIPLTRHHILTNIGAELVALLSNITQDGSLNKGETFQLKQWLDSNKDSDIPALNYLTLTINRIISDGKITKTELVELYKTIEFILPIEIRGALTTRRKDFEKKEKLEEKALKLKNEPIASARFMVAGIPFEGRPEIIQQYVREDVKVFFIRDQNNKYSSNAIKIFIDNGFEIGYVPEEYAPEIAAYLDDGYPHKAYVLRMYIGKDMSYPLIQSFILRKESDIPGIIFPKDLQRFYYQNSNSQNGGENDLAKKGGSFIENFLNGLFK